MQQARYGLVAFDAWCLDVFESKISALLVADLCHAFLERSIMQCVSWHDTGVTDAQHLRLLPWRHLRPRRGAAKPRYERAPVSFDDLVGAGEQRGRHGEAERLGGLEVDHELVLGRRLHRKVGWFLAPENAIDIVRRPLKLSMITGRRRSGRRRTKQRNGTPRAAHAAASAATASAGSRQNGSAAMIPHHGLAGDARRVRSRSALSRIPLFRPGDGAMTG